MREGWLQAHQALDMDCGWHDVLPCLAEEGVGREEVHLMSVVRKRLKWDLPATTLQMVRLFSSSACFSDWMAGGCSWRGQARESVRWS